MQRRQCIVLLGPPCIEDAIAPLFPINRVAAINHEFFLLSFKRHNTAENHPILLKKKKLQRYCTHPRPEAQAGLRQGVPVEGSHHLLHLLDQIHEFVVILCIELQFRDAPYKIVNRVAVRRARRPDPTPL